MVVMKGRFSRLSHSLRFFILSSVFHQGSTRILSIWPHNVSALHVPSRDLTLHRPRPNDLTTDQNIGNLLASLAFQGEPQISQADFLGLTLTARDRSPDLPRSSDITAFRKITLVFRAGGTTPATPLSEQYFHISNRFPNHWEEWGLPNFYEVPPWWLDDRWPVQWDRVQSIMPISFADSLFKDAGYVGSYEAVFLNEIEGRPLQYCFRWGRQGAMQYRVVVEVHTGVVKEVNYRCGYWPPHGPYGG